MPDLTHLLFDLGGVIVELRGKPIKAAWFADDAPDDIWEKWLQSEAPRLFEAGKIDADSFAAQIVEELSLRVTADEFLEYFTVLPVKPYTGAVELLKTVRERYTTACFSNSNMLHWKRKMVDMQLDDCFDHKFASHIMGQVKPDHSAFTQVINSLGIPAAQILFFDDNQLNVDAARHAGMQAEVVAGLDELKRALLERGCMS